MAEIKGWHVFTGFALAFGVIIAVNLTLAFQAVRTFPGLEVKNSYVASQSFEQERRDQVDAQPAEGRVAGAAGQAGLPRHPFHPFRFEAKPDVGHLLLIFDALVGQHVDQQQAPVGHFSLSVFKVFIWVWHC